MRNSNNTDQFSNGRISVVYFGMLLPVLIGGQLMLVPGLLAFVGRVGRETVRSRERVMLALPLLWCVGLVLLYAARLPATYQHGRYAMPMLPPLIVAGIIGAVPLIVTAYQSMPIRVLVRTLTISAALIFVYFGFVLGATAYRQDVQIIEEEMVESAMWIADNLEPEQLLAVHDIGAVGYFAPRPILDLAGLVSVEVAPIYHDDDALWSLMRSRNVDFVMAFLDQLPGNDPDDPRLCIQFQSSGGAAVDAGGSKMTIYALDWGDGCAELG